MKKIKINIYNLLLIGGLLFLFVFRISVNKEKNTWIDAINFAGLIMALLDLCFDICQNARKSKRINFFLGSCVIFFVGLIVLELLIIFEILSFSTLFNDLVTIATLIVALPAELHKRCIINLLNK